MNRIALTDGSNKWFDADVADYFGEGSDWDGSNRISKATGSQFDHETLINTKGGKWILNRWSQMQGHSESYAEITLREVAQWFVKNEYADFELPSTLPDAVPSVIEDLEL